MDDRVRWASRHDHGLPGASDEQLIDRVRGGDKRAFGELYRRHRKAAESAAWCLLHSKSDADDAVSEAFAGVLSALGNGRGPRDNFRRYLLACVRNTCRARRPPSVPMSADQLERCGPVLEDPERYIEADTVARAFGSLAPRWQHTLWLTEVEQRPPSEVGRQLDLSPNATAALSLRARRAFATAYLAEHLGAVTDKECARAAPHLAGYVRNELTAVQLTSVERHLVSCAVCPKAVADLRDVNASLRSLVPVTPEALAGAALATEAALVATSTGGASVGLPGVGVLVKALVAVLVVAPVLTTDLPRADGRSGRSEEQVVLARPSADGAPVADGPTGAESADQLPTEVEVEVVPTQTQRTAPAEARVDLRPAEVPASTAEQEVVVPTVPPMTVPRPIAGLVDGVVDGVAPSTGAITEPVIETLDQTLDQLGLGSTGETMAMLRAFVPLANGPLIGALADRLLTVSSIAPDRGSTTTTVAAGAPEAPVGAQDDASGPPPGSAPPGTAAPRSSPLPQATVAVPPVVPQNPAVTAPVVVVSQITIPPIVVPPITPPIVNLPAVTLPVLNVPAMTVPSINAPPTTVPAILG